MFFCLFLALYEESNIELMPPSETTNMFGSDIIENRRLDFAIVLRATQNFSDANEIGQGGFGRVYKVRREKIIFGTI